MKKTVTHVVPKDAHPGAKVLIEILKTKGFRLEPGIPLRLQSPWSMVVLPDGSLEYSQEVEVDDEPQPDPEPGTFTDMRPFLSRNMRDAFIGDTLIIAVQKLGGKLEIPVEEMDLGPKGLTLDAELNPVSKVFTFTVRRKR